jgi:hypothetical protein
VIQPNSCPQVTPAVDDLRSSSACLPQRTRTRTRSGSLCLISASVAILVLAIAADVSPHRVVGLTAVLAVLVTTVTAHRPLRKHHRRSAYWTLGIFLACDVSGVVAYLSGASIPVTHVILGLVGTILLGILCVGKVARRVHPGVAGAALLCVVGLLSCHLWGAP